MVQFNLELCLIWYTANRTCHRWRWFICFLIISGITTWRKNNLGIEHGGHQASRFIKNKYSLVTCISRIDRSDTRDGAGVDTPATLGGATPHAASELASAVGGALGRIAPRPGRNHRRASVLEVLGPNCLPRHATCRYFIKSLGLNTSTEKSAKNYILYMDPQTWGWYDEDDG
jgi:hypothetical protein